MPDESLPNPLQSFELMAARICHDLSGPIGPMAGILELAREDPDTAEEALDLALQSTAGLVGRIRLIRAAWAGDCGTMDIKTIHEMLTAGLARRRLSIDFSRLAPAPLAPATARLLLNVLMLAAESLPAGGTLACAGQPDGDMIVSIAGPHAGWPAGLAACLANSQAAGRVPAEPRGMQFSMLALLAARPGPRLSLLFGLADAVPSLLISHPGMGTAAVQAS